VERPDWDASDLEAVVGAAFAAFGPRRLLFGSDWPVALLNGSYEHVVRETVAAIRATAGDGADAILCGTALRLYAIAVT
jgi:L-fuconolactonase